MDLRISPGEALDRLSILEIKNGQIMDPVKRAHVQHELQQYTAVISIKESHTVLYSLLYFVNNRIWDLTNTVKGLSVTDATYAPIAHEIFDLNQQRFRLKTAINRATGAEIQEQKSYATSTLCLSYTEITGEDAVDIVYYFLNTDILSVRTQSTHPILKLLGIHILSPDDTLVRTRPLIDKHTEYYKTLCNLFKPIVYISGGMFGDFIHQLSVVCEKYHTTGRKGIVLISDKVGDTHAFSIYRTHADLYDTLMKQEYMHDFRIYANESYDINLSKWRSSPLLYRGSWLDIYKHEFSVQFCKRPWLTATLRPEFIGKTVVSTSMKRWSDFGRIREHIDVANTVFIGFEEANYSYFVHNTGINIPYYHCTTAQEMIDIIYSCTLFVGNLSSPLTFAYGLHKKCLILLPAACIDDVHVIPLPRTYPFMSLL